MTQWFITATVQLQFYAALLTDCITDVVHRAICHIMGS